MSLTITHTRRPLARRTAPAHLASLSANAFEGYASLFNVADGAGDIVQPGAFAASLRKRGAHDIRMLWQHFAQEPIGVWEEVREDSRGLYVRGRLTTDVQRAREAFALLRDGAVNGLSIGFRTRRACVSRRSTMRAPARSPPPPPILRSMSLSPGPRARRPPFPHCRMPAALSRCF